MGDYRATIRWTHARGDFLKGTYSRDHTWSFDAGITVPASPSPHSVPKAFANEAAIDPEEAFVASISSCHMLTFLYVAYKAGFEVASYDDEAVGVMTKNERGVPWVSAVTLHPRIAYGGARQPTREDEDHLHHAAHDGCYIANSVKTEITVAPVRRA